MNNLAFWRSGRDALQGVRRAAVRALQAVNNAAGRPSWPRKTSKLFVYESLAARIAFGDVDLDPAVARAACRIVVRGDRLAFAAAVDHDAIGRDAAHGQVVARMRRTVDRQRLVGRVAADAVGVADDGDRGAGIFIQRAGKMLQHRTEIRLDVEAHGAAKAADGTG